MLLSTAAGTGSGAGSARLRFDRREWAGAFGDIGTDLPLIIALVATCGLDASGVCVMFGLSQIATGLRYGIPMPVQPLKAMAAIMLADKLAPNVLFAGGLIIGCVMLALTCSGGLAWLARHIPEIVVRGLQLGLSLTLARIALVNCIGHADGAGRMLALGCAATLWMLRKQARVPGPLVVVAAGMLFAMYTGEHAPGAAVTATAWQTPGLRAAPTVAELWQGLWALALPQLPLSLANSVIATSRTTHDLFPARAVPVRQIGLTYGLMNLINPWWGGLPVCHGCGGLAGFYGFGARTGGAPVIYGALFVCTGFWLSHRFDAVASLFPLPLLGVVLLFEATRLGLLAQQKIARNAADCGTALAVAVAVVVLPQGYVAGLVIGCGLEALCRRARKPQMSA